MSLGTEEALANDPLAGTSCFGPGGSGRQVHVVAPTADRVDLSDDRDSTGDAPVKQLQWLYARLTALLLATVAGTSPALSQSTDSDSAAWQDAQQEGTLGALQGYLETYPSGKHSEEAFRQIVEQSLQEEPGAGAGGLSTDLY